jgi:hypothetical protein
MYVIPSRAILILEGQLLLRIESNMGRKFKKLIYVIEEFLLRFRQDLIVILAQSGMIKIYPRVLGRIVFTLVNSIPLPAFRG